MEVNVGQILFVLNSKNHSLLPAQVDEVLVSRTVKGETTQHILVFQNDKKIVLEKLQTPWFTELDSARSYLLKEAEKMIDSVLSNAKDAADEHFGSPQSPSPDAISVSEISKFPQLESESPSMTVDLGDGRQARVTLPEEFNLENTSG